tara:strand:+ start:172 stop:390 length:219 start_codon:yes stop_codon:yes gene_type:complete
MVANKLAQLNDSELTLIEKVLHKEFITETEKNKSWQTKNQYEKPFHKANTLIKCIGAIQAQRNLNKKLEVRW